MSSRPERETAYRVFAAEFDDVTLSYTESDEERAPNYVVTPTGARVNRLFAVGVLTEIEAVNDTQLRARIVDPTGAFIVYAGQYQPEALSFLEGTTPPEFVAVTGKARTFQPEDSDRVFTSVRPETLSEVDAATRDRFTVDTAMRTTERVETMREALTRAERGDELRAALEDDDVEGGLAAGIPRAIAHYATTTEYLDAVEEMALNAARVVAGDREAVDSLDVAPNEGGADHTAVADTDEPVTPATNATSPTEPATGTDDGDGGSDEADVVVESEPAIENEPGDESAAVGSETETDSAEATESMDESGESNSEPDSFDSGDEADERSGGIEPAADDEGPESAAETESATDLDDPEEFELSRDEREEVESEYGTEFETASEVDAPGEADIETPAPADEPAVEAEVGASRIDETEEIEADPGPEEDADDGADGSVDESDDGMSGGETDDIDGSTDVGDEDADSAADIDPEEAVVTVMRELDDGDGADREAVTERVVEEYGLTPAEVDDGIREALMSGECYEPDDDTLKAI